MAPVGNSKQQTDARIASYISCSSKDYLLLQEAYLLPAEPLHQSELSDLPRSWHRCVQEVLPSDQTHRQGRSVVRHRSYTHNWLEVLLP